MGARRARFQAGVTQDLREQRAAGVARLRDGAAVALPPLQIAWRAAVRVSVAGEAVLRLATEEGDLAEVGVARVMEVPVVPELVV
jgi:hypothetical protein